MDSYFYYSFFAFFQVCLIIQLYYLIFKHNRINQVTQNPTEPVAKLPVSVVICARNEAENLKENLPSILTQSYPDFEVIVVNDCSGDDSEFILKDFAAVYPNLRIVTVTEHARYKTGKKFALTLGIKAAKNEYLLFTDADCKAASSNWIMRMQKHFSEGKELVLGYSPYFKKSGFLNILIRFETLKTAIGYLSAALSGKPYMGVGRNLGYTKSLFFKGKGFAAHMHLVAGDDDLFVNQNSTKNNTAIEIAADSMMFSKPKSSLKALYRQKKRHMGVGKFYKSSHRRMLSFEALSGMLLYVMAVLLLILNFQPLAVLGLLIFRYILQFIIYRKIFSRLECGDLLPFYPILELIYYIYLNAFGFISLLTKKIQWK